MPLDSGDRSIRWETAARHFRRRSLAFVQNHKPAPILVEGTKVPSIAQQAQEIQLFPEPAVGLEQKGGEEGGDGQLSVIVILQRVHLLVIEKNHHFQPEECRLLPPKFRKLAGEVCEIIKTLLFVRHAIKANRPRELMGNSKNLQI